MVHIIREIYHHPHSIRDIKVSQLGELYLAMMIKTLGLSLIGIFVPVYLYQLGYGVDTIALFYALLYGTRIITDNIAAVLIGYYGPKHVMILSHIFLILSLVLLLTLETIVWPLWLIALTSALAGGLFFMSYHIEFSKIQSAKHAGKQIGTMYKLAKLASATGPLLGGIIATYFGVQITIVLAMALILTSALPLAMSPEPVRKHQHVTWKNFPWRKVKWDVISNSGLGFDQMSTNLLWPLYVSIFIFSENVYLSVGLLTSLGLATSVVMATVYGRIIDKGGGGIMLKFGVLGVSISHALRMVINSSGLAYLFNFSSDSVSVAVRMPYTKGLYHAASSHEGYRNAYIAVIMTGSNILRFAVFIILFFLAAENGDKYAMQTIFGISAVLIWLVNLQKYKALK